jgi:speckle-type POZ protein
LLEISGKKFFVDPVEAEKDLTDDLKRLLLSQELADVEIEVEGMLFKAHRNILTARSEQFKTLLCENLRQDRLNKPIHIENMSSKCFKALLHFFYTNELEENTESVIACELIRVGFWYNLDDLRRIAFNFIQSKLSEENVIELIVCALNKEPVLDDVQEICMKFIAKNFSSLVNRADFKRLPQHILIKLTQFYAQFHK